MYKKFFILGLLGSAILAKAQSKPEQKNDTIALRELTVISDLPITTQLIKKSHIEAKNLGQDMPILLKNATAVVTTSDAGAGIGYTAMRIRGIGKDQINVTFNGVPVNDSESHSVYWVDFPDISSSTGGLIIQRGVGTSSNGATSFGGSVNLDTEGRTTEVSGEAMAALGSFNTQKYMFKGTTGDLANGKFNADIRATQVNSDGYRDRATSNLSSVALNARYMPSENTEIHLMNIYGYERTYQAWNPISAKDLRQGKISRTYNPSGAIKNNEGKIEDYWKNEVDNYNQNHTHLYWKQKYANGWKSKATLHYTKGLGYYENYKQGRKLKDYKIENLNVKKADMIRRKWLDNNFFGGIFNIENTSLGNRNTKFYAGIAASKYIGDHYGEIIKLIGHPNYRQNGYYYYNRSNKVELSAFIKALKRLGNLEVFGDLQLRRINYSANPVDNNTTVTEDFKPFDLNYTFFNPKAGINYYFTPKSKVYATFGVTHREPTRDDIKAGATKAEQLQDAEVGYRVQTHSVSFGLNGYYMFYNNQLVLTGKIDPEVGSPVRENVGKSYRRGVEVDVAFDIIKDKLNLYGNLAYSQNKNKNFVLKDEKGSLKNLGDTDISFSPNLVGSVGFDISPVKGMNINLVNKYVSEQYVTNTQDNRFKLDSYFLSDLAVGYNIPLGKEETMQLNFMLNNIFNKEYSNNGADYGELSIFPQAGRNFLAGLKFTF